ncbi:MAG: ATP-dependent zinc metalloprotease FtsH [Candidatus Wolfebacteria bacterium GW2011_GWC1_43_10]|uniref:ATP-dependent zinc metalloprotease FtsH n=1 Tax=Candidatus Wolfebacteria bacterium GW2011_GWC1_43_10 TaxID=1619011 RepID=A0A0G1CA44_9BACT|nr:MAG: ATP-dependent zinc metalloprotease FtsH [Candidatus Wolfebacteria bacterium GW2011_GWC1_43_10]KKT23120.1 MAG: ATP-dependent zinc metalloprotease FtsH [Parcubacteria group bacterium GW2011_GWB1_43_8b]KKT85607.1 MAG: ATP-dependent zinc metalloprotease FtsH [Parcubacteria group bacterium GW2011_GWA1_Parcubacteria_45_10]
MKNNLVKNIFVAILLFVSILLLFSALSVPQEEVGKITLSELATKINENQISQIVVEGEIVKVTFVDGQKGQTKKEAESSLSQTLNNFGVDSTKLSQIPTEIKDESSLKFWAVALLPTLIPIIIIGLFFWLTFRQARSGASQVFNFGKSNIKLFTPFKDRITFTDVAGLKEAKQELLEVVDFLRNPKKYLELGARIPRGVLLLGLPGTGKTLMARAVAGEAQVPFFHISASEFVEMFVGVGASRTRDAFSTAKKAAPSILFVDEIDAVGRERGAGLGGGHDEREQTLNQILVEMDGFDKETQVIVLAATNRPDILDPALLRPGRFDRRVVLDLPDLNDREEILKIHSRNKALATGTDLRQVATRTPGFSGADLANLMNEGAILAARKGKKQIEQTELYESIEKVLLGPERRSRVLNKKEKEITAYHEAGHALVAASLKDADLVHKISIVARGQAGGYTLKLPIEDVHLKTRRQFLADMAAVFGGYSAEEIVFGDISTGAANDLQIASEMARKLVTKYGMSEKFGPITFGKTEELVFLGREIATEKNYSDAVAFEIDKEVEKFIQKAHQIAKKSIQKRKKVLRFLAKTLIEKETIEKEEFDQIIRKFKVKPERIKV